MSDNEMLYCLVAFILGWLTSQMIGNGFSVGGNINGRCYINVLALKDYINSDDMSTTVKGDKIENAQKKNIDAYTCAIHNSWAKCNGIPDCVWRGHGKRPPYYELLRNIPENKIEDAIHYFYGNSPNDDSIFSKQNISDHTPIPNR